MRFKLLIFCFTFLCGELVARAPLPGSRFEHLSGMRVRDFVSNDLGLSEVPADLLSEHHHLRAILHELPSGLTIFWAGRSDSPLISPFLQRDFTIQFYSQGDFRFIEQLSLPTGDNAPLFILVDLNRESLEYFQRYARNILRMNYLLALRSEVSTEEILRHFPGTELRSFHSYTMAGRNYYGQLFKIK